MPKGFPVDTYDTKNHLKQFQPGAQVVFDLL